MVAYANDAAISALATSVTKSLDTPTPTTFMYRADLSIANDPRVVDCQPWDFIYKFTVYCLKKIMYQYF